MKKIAIMQPYFFPYIGYFQLIKSVDEFVIYDNIQYTRKGWINRNRILNHDKEKTITLSLKKSASYVDIRDKKLSDIWLHEKYKIINFIKFCYAKAPYFNQVFPLIEESLLNKDINLFNFLFNSLKKVNSYLDIETKIIMSSSLNIDHSLKCQNKIISICRNLNSQNYINPIGGISLYNKKDFNNEDIELNFIESDNIRYKQFKSNFIANLSIIDVLMFNSREKVKKYLTNYNLK